MTATDILRRLLDERGVEWWEEDGHTLWYGESLHHAASAFSSFMFGESERVHLNAMVTPEQAVAATLGRGTCHETIIDHYWRGCGECGYIWEFMYGIGKCESPHYCPNCGREVVNDQ